MLATLSNLGYPLLAVRRVPAPGQPTAGASAATADARREAGPRLPTSARVSGRAIRRTGRRTQPLA